ncbi:Sporulation kinase E [compost metagenome]
MVFLRKGVGGLANYNSFGVHITKKELDSCLNQCVQSVLIINAEERIVQGNLYFHDFSGYSAEEIKGMPITKLIQTSSSLNEIYQQYFASGQVASELPIALVHTLNSGAVKQLFYMLKVESNQGTLYAIWFKGLVEAPQLNLLQRFSDAFLNDVNLGVILINMDYTIVDVSDMACKVLGLERAHILTKSMESVFAAVPLEHQLVQRTILTGMVVRNHAVSWMNDQERYELLLDSNVLRDHQGQIIGAYLIFKDVSNLRSLEEQVQRSDRLAMIGQIAAGTAHEIRNPLTSIKGFLQVLNAKFVLQGWEKEQGYTEVMLSEIDRINELVSEFLLLSKPKHVSYEQTDISSVIKGILPIINNVAILHKVHLQYDSSIHMPKVMADQELLKQVFLNLSKNGIEAMVEGGNLTISERIDVEERKVNIDIHDTGPGIPLFVIDKIFDPFFTTKDTGTGLGLSVCQRIIHDMSGSIRVSSKGYGTTFTVSIPYP